MESSVRTASVLARIQTVHLPVIRLVHCHRTRLLGECSVACGRRWFWSDHRYCFGICLELLGQTIKESVIVSSLQPEIFSLKIPKAWSMNAALSVMFLERHM